MAHPSLQTAEHEEVLNIIDTLRSQGISSYIDLPQVIVCGDQSSGKSSVLEAISGLRFPTKDNLCTRFATELILRRSPASSVVVIIIPGPDRSEDEAAALAKFVPPSTSVSEFSTIVRSAEKAMGLDNHSAVFSKDILRVELSGPTQANLTLVDLPGIFWASDQSQSDDDASLVQSLVKSYMENKRSIILAVVSAKSDLVMQVITKLARETDPEGQRTLGIITKPDTLHAGSDSEALFVKLAKNENIRFKLGWHVLKNRDYDTKDTTSEERDAAEREFFQSRVWSSALPSNQLGIETLRPRLSRVLLGQILAELPSLVRDVEIELQACQERLGALGASRGTISDQRMYLLKVSQTFLSLMTAAVEGVYVDGFFSDPDTKEGYAKRLRAVVSCAMDRFAEKMRREGHAQQIVSAVSAQNQERQQPKGPQLVVRDDFIDSVRLRMRRNRGRELPGIFNPSIIGDLFFDQSKPWQQIFHDTEKVLNQAARATVNLVLEHVADSVTRERILRHVVRPNLEPIATALHIKVNEVLRPHTRGHPLTFNHYFTENLQKKRQDQARTAMGEKLLKFFHGKDATNEHLDLDIYVNVAPRQILDVLAPKTELDMEKFACIDAINAMEAYYKVRSPMFMKRRVLTVQGCAQICRGCFRGVRYRGMSS
jgi:GTPase SAR1 family protein